MISSNNTLITRLTVRLQDSSSLETVGTAIIYSDNSLKNHIYILTAAHCLYHDGDGFSTPRENINVAFFDPINKEYQCLFHKINLALVNAEIEKDVAILVFAKSQVEAITGVLPQVKVVRERNNHLNLHSKGFPSATEGKELIYISPSWSQHEDKTNRLHMTLEQDFSDQFSPAYRVEGFSGSGIFINHQDNIYLLGVISRFLDAGKILYGQYIQTFSALLGAQFLPPFQFTFLGEHDIDTDFFKSASERALSNLGPRFNEGLNFELPIARLFNSMAKDNYFKHSLSEQVHGYLEKDAYGHGSKELKEIDECNAELREKALKWFTSIEWTPEKTIELSDIEKSFGELNAKIESRTSELYDKRWKIKSEKKEEKKEAYAKDSFVNEINRLGELRDKNSDFLNACHDSHINLANKPILLIKGDPGSGKSHLLGDVVRKRNLEGLPTLLTLGHKFTNQRTIWENILAELQVNCTIPEFLETLNAIGKQVGSRVLLLIDAINEGAGRVLWRDGLAGLITDILKYPYIGLVITIRTTYWNTIIPANIQNDRSIAKAEHTGFKGNEYEALKLFCDFYDLQQPNFPLMNPEYANPLFLHLVCKGISHSPEKVFPQGFQGITRVFTYYLQAVQERLVQKSNVYVLYPKVIRKAIELFSEKCFELDNSRFLSLEDCVLLFKTNFSEAPDLLLDLIEESIFFRTVNRSGEAEDDEAIYFAYERLGDYFVAEKLLSGYTDREQVVSAFEKGTTLGNLIVENYWYNDGTIEALAVLLPERFQLELFEVYQWAYQEEDGPPFFVEDSMTRCIIQSLKSRKLDSIDNTKLTKWIRNEKQFRLDDHEYFNFLYEMSAVKGHPFNSERLSRILHNSSMAERDAYFQYFMLYYRGGNDHGEPYAISRLIDWSWREKVSTLIDDETAFLAGQALTWILSTTDTVLRDRCTKAMVNLLQNRPLALTRLLNTFSDIDDLYISERLYAVAYGCALRSKDNKKLEIIARTVYGLVFSSGKCPNHLLLRDYCRNTVEYAWSKGLISDIAIDEARPPYGSPLPAVFPSDAEIQSFKIENETGDYNKKRAAQAVNEMIYSVTGWDFSRYVIEPAFNHFTSVKVNYEEEFIRFRKNLPRGGKTKLKDLEDIYKLHSMPDHKMRYIVHQFRDYKKTVAELHTTQLNHLATILTETELNFLTQDIYTYWRRKYHGLYSDSKLSIKPIQNWIVKRVFELGFSGELHGDYDRGRSDYSRFSEDNKIERIGKKYQWQALYEILGIYTDNYKIADSFSHEPPKLYNGPWDIVYRDIDPSFTRRVDRAKYERIDFGIINRFNDWSQPPKYDFWHRPKQEWAAAVADLPKPADCLSKIDPMSKKWLFLDFSYNWKEPQIVGKSGFGDGRKEVYYQLQAFLVKSKDFEKMVTWLKGRDFHGRWLPEPGTSSQVFAREHYWSPISKFMLQEQKEWVKLEGAPAKMMLAAREGSGRIDNDKSQAQFSYKAPCLKLFESLDLRYSDIDGEFENKASEILMSNSSPIGSMIRMDEFIAFLKKEDFKVLWTLMGEKNMFFRDDYEEGVRKKISGVYTLDENSNIIGNFKIANW